MTACSRAWRQRSVKPGAGSRRCLVPERAVNYLPPAAASARLRWKNQEPTSGGQERFRCVAMSQGGGWAHAGPMHPTRWISSARESLSKTEDRIVRVTSASQAGVVGSPGYPPNCGFETIVKLLDLHRNYRVASQRTPPTFETQPYGSLEGEDVRTLTCYRSRTARRSLFP